MLQDQPHGRPPPVAARRSRESRLGDGSTPDRAGNGHFRRRSLISGVPDRIDPALAHSDNRENTAFARHPGRQPMMSTIGGRLRRAGVMAAWLPIATAAWAEEGDDHVSSTIAASANAAAFGVEIVGDALVIEGTPEDDRILIKATREPDTVRVIFNGVRLGHFGPLARIEVDAGDGDDTVLVSGAVELPARIDGGPGDDRLRGGAGPDLVFGKDGDDVLVASRGRDALDTGLGSNRLVVRRTMGEIQVGSSAAGDALRILAKAYDLRPLAADPSARR
ncbi:MAG: hypothetical protein ACREIR_10185, partial [Geminicoccaceae bacterium]